MNFKDMLNKISSLSEATEKTKTGVKHSADAGGYGRKVDASGDNDDEPKKKRGGQEKDDGPKFDVPKGDLFGRTSGKAPAGKKGTQHTKMKDADKAEKKAEKAEKKKGLKEWMSIAENTMPGAQLNVKPMPGASQLTDQSGKVIATGPADKIKAMQASAAKGEVTLGGGDEMEEGMLDQVRANNPNSMLSQVRANRNDPNSTLNKIRSGQSTPTLNNVRDRMAQRQAGTQQAVAEDDLNEKDIGQHNNATTGFDALVKKLTPKYGVEAAKRIAGSQLKKIKEAERPSFDSTMGAGLGAGRSQGVLEGKKPDFLDIDKDGDKKEPMKKAAQDKKKVKEGMNHILQAARLEGKSHGLKGHAHCGKNYEDMEEARMYHEGYKEGLDECYGQGGLGKVMGETDALPATVPGMAAAAEPAMEDDMYEMDKSEWMSHKAKSTPGDTFKAFGQTFKDKEVVESPFAFEAWDQQLNSLLTEGEQVNEGMTVSITKGQQGAPDSVSINAQDAEADKLLAFVKQAGLGIFGGEEAPTSAYGAPTSNDAEGGSNVGGISVVDDHDGMMNLMKKLSGMGGEVGPQDSQDYEEEGSDEEHSHEHGEEESCNECGMAYESCGCDDKEMVEDDSDDDGGTIGGPDDETSEEYLDQAEEEVAEAEEVVNNDDEANEENSDAVRDAALAQAADNNEEQVDEGEYANSDDDTFAADIDFMTNIISGGLNKKKSTGQTTIPVIAGQEERMTANESIVADWKKLAGIK
jgi:hypothetical protein